MNSPTRSFKDVEKLVNEGSKQLDNIDSVIEINGFPQKAEENNERLVIDLVDDMDISIRLYDIRASHRLSKREKAGRAIIVMQETNFVNQGNNEWGLNCLCCVYCICISQNH